MTTEDASSVRASGRRPARWLARRFRQIVQAIFLVGFLALLFLVCRRSVSAGAGEAFAAREVIDAEVFLWLDPLVSVTTALAGRTWVPALAWGAGVLLICVLIPRAFCGYVCPMGTLIDLSDWVVGRRFGRFHLARRGWWVHSKYFLLGVLLVAAGLGVVLSGFFAPIPILTRSLASLTGMTFPASPTGAATVGAVPVAAVAILVVVLALGVFGPRFWCRYICPSGAALSLAGFFRLTGRNVTARCIDCGRCVRACSFDAIAPDFSTRGADCTFCRACAWVCPTGAIRFTTRWDKTDLKAPSQNGGRKGTFSRRGFLAGGVAGAVGGLAAGLGLRPGRAATGQGGAVIRPPGSVPEGDFLRLCVRCGECIGACPTGVLQPVGLAAGLTGLWTPRADTDRAGCAPDCNVCGQVCPTGAIRALDLPEKGAARMGLAVVNHKTCLPWSGWGDCGLCVAACKAAEHDAIEFRLARPELDADGMPIEDTGFLAPHVLPDACVGCGLCQVACRGANVRDKGLLAKPAIRVHAGPGKEDRIRNGSYRALRRKRNPPPPPVDVEY